jgi:hypothetical protein
VGLVGADLALLPGEEKELEMTRNLILAASLALSLGFGFAGCSSGSRSPNTAPEISTSPITTAVVGQEYRYAPSFSGDPFPVGVSVENLPSWLTYQDGVISGTPALDDVGITPRILLVVSNGTNPDARQTWRITVTHNGPLFSLNPSATNGILEAPPGTTPDEFTINSAFGTGAVAANGAFSVPTTGKAQLVWATRGGRTQLVSILNAAALDNRVSARTTAASLAFLNAGLATTPSRDWNGALQIAAGDSALAALQSAVEGVATANGDILATTSLQSTLSASGQSLAGALNTRADAATAPVVSGTDIQQIYRVSPALPRSGLMIDTGQNRIRNDRRRTVFAAAHLAGTQPALSDYESLPVAGPGAEITNIDLLWKGFRSEGGVSSFAPVTDLLVGFEERYVVTLVGTSLRQGSWPAEGTNERILLRRAMTTDAGRHHLQNLALTLGFDANDLRGALGMITQRAANEGVAGGLALDLTVAQTANPGLWTVLDAYAGSVANAPALGTTYNDMIRECVGGLSAQALTAGEAILGRLAQTQRTIDASDAPVVLYQEASDPLVTFEVDPSQEGNNNGLTIVLEWGENPNDLDSHLLGPNGLHLYYPDAEDSGSGSPEKGHVSLDLDDTSSFGPETTAILEPRQGNYRFSVFDFSNGSDPQATGIASSSATVKVYQGSNPVPLATFTAPTQAGNAWLVFDYNGSTGVITPLNQVAAVANELSIPTP